MDLGNDEELLIILITDDLDEKLDELPPGFEEPL